MKKQTGFMLIEVMLSSILALIVIGFLLEIYLSAQQAMSVQAELIAIEHHAKLLTSILNVEISQAGHLGCRRLHKDQLVVSNPPYMLNAHNRLTGTDSKLTIRKMENHVVTLLEDMRDTIHLTTSAEIRFHRNEILIIADFKQAEMFVVDQVSLHQATQFITAKHPLSHQYQQQAEVGKLSIHQYFVGPTHKLDDHQQPISAFFVEDMLQSIRKKYALVEGVRKINFQYTVLRNGQLIDLPYTEVEDWSAVRGVAATIELQTLNLKKTWYLFAAL